MAEGKGERKLPDSAFTHFLGGEFFYKKEPRCLHSCCVHGLSVFNWHNRINKLEGEDKQQREGLLE